MPSELEYAQLAIRVYRTMGSGLSLSHFIFSTPTKWARLRMALINGN